MGILRTDKISGLETPTPVTGSVVFDGTGDYVTSSAFHIADSWTMEFWFNTSVNNAAQRPMNFSSDLSASDYAYIELGSSGTIKARVAGAAAFGSVSAPPVNQWHHTALSYDGSTAYFLLNGKLIASQSVSYSNHSIQVRFGADESNASANLYTGYISNARIVSGEALYTTNYTVPIHAFEATEGTNLLCFNNADSAAASEHGRPGAAPPTLTVTGDAAASSVSPGLTRDFTYGTEFKGVTTFDTQGYFVPPSGTTEQRDISLSTKPGGSGRAVSFGGEQSPLSPSVIRAIDTIVIPSLGDATDFGDLSQDNRKNTAASSSTRGLCVDGATPSATNVIEFITFAATGSSTDFGDTVQNVVQSGGASNGIRGVFAGGYNDADFMEYVTIATEGNAQDFGDLIQRRFDLAGFASPSRGVFAGGKFTPSPTINQMNSIEYVTIASTGNAQDFGDMTFASRNPVGTSSQIRGVIGGGFTTSPSNASYNNIDFITIASTGNAFDFGDLTSARSEIFGSTSNSLRAVFMGGDESPGGSRVNIIDFVQIQTTGNAIDFGDLTTPKSGASACSDSHGGLS